jgi:hypothetical protein
MKSIDKTFAQNHAGASLMLLALVAGSALRADAKHQPVHHSEKPVTVVAHIALMGPSADQMDLHEDGGKQYLYIGMNSNKGLAVIDVTNPDHPNVIKRLAWPNEVSPTRLRMVSGALALAEGPDSDSAAADPVPPTRTVKVLDLSDPANPRTVLSFSGVTSTLEDEARNLVYIANGEGLWILQNNQSLATAARRQTCTSDDAYNDVASCR